MIRTIRFFLMAATASSLLLAGCGQATDNADSKAGGTTTAGPSATATSQKPAGEQRMAFVSNRDGAYHLYTMNADGGDIRKMSNHVVSEFPYSVSRDGTQIAAWEGWDETNDAPSPRIFRIDVADGSAQLLGEVPMDEETGGPIVMPPHWQTDDEVVLLSAGASDVCYSLPAGGGEPHEESPDKCMNPIVVAEGPGGQIAGFAGTSLMVSAKPGTLGRKLDQIMVIKNEENGEGAGWDILGLSVMLSMGALQPVWSPDGKLIAYVDFDAEGDQTGLSIVSVDGGEPRLLVPFDMQKDVLSPKAWSADGKRIIFSGFNEGSAIQDMNVDTGEVRTLAGNDGFTYLQPHWVTIAPPPERAVTPSNSAGQAADLKDLLKSECGHFVYEEPYGAMFSVALDGSGARIINPDPPFPLSLSADASLMAYDRRIQSEGRWSLVLFDVAQQQERELGEGGTPGLSPSGKMLAYWSDGLVVMNLKTGEQRKVYDANPSDVVQPAWSPDETRIAFLARSETGDTSDNLETDLIVVDLRTDASATIAKPDGLWPGSPVAWSPDGSRIAFADSHLHLVSADGSDRHNYLIDAESVAWSPSGDMLVIRDSGKISLVDPKSGIETWLTSDAGGVVTIPPAWSPDGRLFAYASLRDELVVMDVATRATITVLPNANEPRWISQGCPSP